MQLQSAILRKAGRAAMLAGVAALTVSLCVAPVLAKPGGGGKPKPGGGGTAGTSYQVDLRTQWRVRLAGSYSFVRPAVHPVTGTVYVVDVADNLYAFRATPSTPGQAELLWMAPDAGSKGVGISRDGTTVYTGNEDWIKAYDASTGALKWTFTQTPRAFILIDVAVPPINAGDPPADYPDVCAVASSGMGIFCLRDGGDAATVSWQNPEVYARTLISYTEIGFGPGVGGTQLYFAANAHTRSVRVHDGANVFTLGYAGPPVVSPLDGSWHRVDAAFNPDGTLAWTFGGFPLATGGTTPSLGHDGTHYTTNQGIRVFAIDPLGTERWQRELDEGIGAPDVDPIDSQVLLPIGSNDVQGAVRAISAGNGANLWRGELYAPSAGMHMAVDAALAFSPSGDMVYVLARGMGSLDPAQNGLYLHAIATDPAIPKASTILRSDQVVLSGASKRRTVSFTGAVTVVDESRAPVSGAVVTATWTLPNGSKLQQTATSGGGGVASFSVSEGGGVYKLTVDNIESGQYVFDPAHGELSASLALF